MSIGGETTDEIVGSLLRKAPIVLKEIQESYEVTLGDITIFSFDFADPLALETEGSLIDGS